MGKAATLRNFVADVRDAAGEFDVVHAMLPVPGADVYQPRGGSVPAQRAASLRRRRLPGRALAAVGWACNAFRRAQGTLERRVCEEKRTFVLAGSEMVAEEFRRYYGRRNRVRVVYNAVDPPRHSAPMRADLRQRKGWELGVGPDATVFVTIATNFRLKGVDWAIRALARLRERNPDVDARLVAIGQDEPARYALLAEKLGVIDSVDFPGRLADVACWYAAADACILLSWYDPCSRVVLEAATWGVPAITTVYNGAAEAMADGGGIVVASPTDVDAVAAAMGELADPANRAKRSNACLAAAERLGMDRHVDELLEVYGEVVAQR